MITKNWSFLHFVDFTSGFHKWVSQFIINIYLSPSLWWLDSLIELMWSHKKGKHYVGHLLVAMNIAGHLPSRLLFISDKKTGCRFPVDTGAQMSVIPPTVADRKHKQDIGVRWVRAVNGSSIPTYGMWCITMDLGLQRLFRWIFIVVDIQTPILGANFLREYGLLVNLRQGCLLDATKSLQSNGIFYHTVSPSPSLTQLHNTGWIPLCDQTM